MPPPPGNKALLRDYQPLVSLNKALLGPYFLGGGIGGGTLDSHDDSKHHTQKNHQEDPSCQLDHFLPRVTLLKPNMTLENPNFQ